MPKKKTMQRDSNMATTYWTTAWSRPSLAIHIPMRPPAKGVGGWPRGACACAGVIKKVPYTHVIVAGLKTTSTDLAETTFASTSSWVPDHAVEKGGVCSVYEKRIKGGEWKVLIHTHIYRYIKLPSPWDTTLHFICIYIHRKFSFHTRTRLPLMPNSKNPEHSCLVLVTQ